MTTVSQLAAPSTTLSPPWTRPYETLRVTRLGDGDAAHVLHIQWNRPKRLNAMSRLFFSEFADCLERTSAAFYSADAIRVVLLSANGRVFTAGLDLMDHMGAFGSAQDGTPDASRLALTQRQMLAAYQRSANLLADIPQPVIAAVHNACIGGGVDFIAACDVRHCSADAFFSIKEIDIGLAADLGTLQRLPKIMGNQSLVKELALTGRRMKAPEAERAGLVSRVYADRSALMEGTTALALDMAAKSPIALMGTKHLLNHAADHSVREGLQYTMAWNAAMLQSADITEAAMSSMSKKKPVFSRL